MSMPGMMDTVLNVGLNDVVVEGLAKQVNDRFAWDCYRRLLQVGVLAGLFRLLLLLSGVQCAQCAASYLGHVACAALACEILARGARSAQLHIWHCPVRD